MGEWFEYFPSCIFVIVVYNHLRVCHTVGITVPTHDRYLEMFLKLLLTVNVNFFNTQTKIADMFLF